MHVQSAINTMPICKSLPHEESPHMKGSVNSLQLINHIVSGVKFFISRVRRRGEVGLLLVDPGLSIKLHLVK